MTKNQDTRTSLSFSVFSKLKRVKTFAWLSAVALIAIIDIVPRNALALTTPAVSLADCQARVAYVNSVGLTTAGPCIVTAQGNPGPFFAGQELNYTDFEFYNGAYLGFVDGRTFAYSVPFSPPYTPQKNLGNKAGCGCNASKGVPVVADPINAATGNAYRSDTDYAGNHWLRFERFYNSDPTTKPDTMGQQWRHTYSRSILVSPLGFIALERPDGRQESFAKTNGVWVPDADVPDTLTEIDDAQGVAVGYTAFIAELRQTETYNAAGQLQSISDPTGQSEVLSYSTSSTPPAIAPSAGLLLSVTDPSGRQLNIVYDSHGRVYQVTLPDNGTLTYGYDAGTYGRNSSSGNLISVQYPDSHVLQYVYDESALTSGTNLPSALTGVVDETGTRYENTTFDSEGRATSSSFAGNIALTQIAFNSDSSSTVTYPLGITSTSTYATVQGLMRIATADQPCNPQCNQPWKVLAYDSNGYPSSKTDFNNVATKTTYDANGLLDQEVDALGTASQRTITTQWNIPLRVPLARTIVDENNVTVAQMGWAYNAMGQTTARCEMDPTVAAAAAYTCSATGTSPSGVRRWVYGYCVAVDNTQCPMAGLLLSVTGPRTDVSDITSYAYYLTDSPTSKQGDLKSITDALGHITNFLAYDGAGRILTQQDVNGVYTDFTYSPRGWLLTRTIRSRPDNSPGVSDATTAITYTAYGSVQTVTDPDGVVVTYGYDSAHRLTDVTDALGNNIHYTLDAAGNKQEEQTYSASRTVLRSLGRSFNVLGQLTSVTDGLNQTVFSAGYSDSYDGNGNLIHSADGNAYEQKQAYDPLNRLTSIIQNYSGTDQATRNTSTSFSYDTLDRLVGVTDPSGLATSYSYDGLNDRTSVQSPDAGLGSDTFDTAGSLLTHTDPKGVVSTSTYDAINRQTSVSFSDSSQTNDSVLYFYDDGAGYTGCANSEPIGRLTRIYEYSVVTEFCYDAQGRVTEKQENMSGNTNKTFYSYTPAGRLKTVLTPNGTLTTYGYNSYNGQVSSVSVTLPGASSSISVVSSISWNPFGPIASYTLGNGQVITRAYDANYRLTDLTSPNLNLHFALGVMGDVNAEGNAPGANPAAETYSYDPLYRLTNIADRATLVEGLTYGPTGDRLSKTGNGLGVGAYVYTSGTHQLLSVGNAMRQSDANGNTTANVSAGQAWGYGYNGRHRMTVVQANGVTVGTYTYNAMGQRIQKVATTPAISQRYAYDEQNHLIGEYASAANRDNIWMGDVPVATIDTVGSTSSLNYVVADQAGTPRSVTNSSGSTIWSMPYTGNPFGELQPTSSVGYVLNLRFAGQYFDQESGLSNWGFRIYDSSTGRSLQSDPSGLLGGMSTYAYAQNNPLRYVDPSGLWVCAAGNCDLFIAALQSLIDASTSSNLDPYQQATLANIVAAYGAYGVQNVVIKYGSLGPGKYGNTTTDPDTGCETVIFDDKKLNALGNAGDYWGQTVTHEGQHVSDDAEWFSGFPVPTYDSEVNAYAAQAFFNQANQFSSGQNGYGTLWSLSGGVDWTVINNRAALSTQVDSIK